MLPITRPPQIIKNIEKMNDTISHLNIIDIYKTLHPKVDYALFSRAH